MNTFDVCVVGGGASGCVCAILLAKQGKSVCVVDKFDKPAKKILATGNGHCNITNQNLSGEFYNKNIDSYLSRFDAHSTTNLFKQFGLDIYADDQGRCYPVSNSAKTVQFVLINQLNKYNVTFFGETEVTNITKRNTSFLIDTKSVSKVADSKDMVANKICLAKSKSVALAQGFGVQIKATQVVLACGINKTTMDICGKLGLDITAILPSLCALKTSQSTKNLDGLRLSNITAKICGTNVCQTGEVLFKDKGLSGICIFNLSHYFAKNGAFLGKISLNLAKNYTKKQIIDMLTAKVNIFKNAHDLLCSAFDFNLAKEILQKSNVPLILPANKITSKQFADIAQNIVDFKLDVVGSYPNNQVFCGGVKLDCLTNNLEAKNCNNLFVCGELCDVNGVCGGYNLQWAWTSASIVASAVTNCETK